MGWQFDRPEKGDGMVQAFRRPDSPFESARFLLRGLDADAQYSAASIDSPDEAVYSGRELLERGLPVRSRSAPEPSSFFTSD